MRASGRVVAAAVLMLAVTAGWLVIGVFALVRGVHTYRGALASFTRFGGVLIVSVGVVVLALSGLTTILAVKVLGHRRWARTAAVVAFVPFSLLTLAAVFATHPVTELVKAPNRPDLEKRTHDEPDPKGLPLTLLGGDLGVVLLLALPATAKEFYDAEILGAS